MNIDQIPRMLLFWILVCTACLKANGMSPDSTAHDGEKWKVAVGATVLSTYKYSPYQSVSPLSLGVLYRVHGPHTLRAEVNIAIKEKASKEYKSKYDNLSYEEITELWESDLARGHFPTPADPRIGASQYNLYGGSIGYEYRHLRSPALTLGGGLSLGVHYSESMVKEYEYLISETTPLSFEGLSFITKDQKYIRYSVSPYAVCTYTFKDLLLEVKAGYSAMFSNEHYPYRLETYSVQTGQITHQTGEANSGIRFQNQFYITTGVYYSF